MFYVMYFLSLIVSAISIAGIFYVRNSRSKWGFDHIFYDRSFFIAMISTMSVVSFIPVFNVILAGGFVFVFTIIGICKLFEKFVK